MLAMNRFAGHAPSRRVALAGLMLGALAPSAWRAAHAGERAPLPGIDVSEAERLLFLQAHLANIQPPRLLRYRYVRESPGEARVVDEATLLLTRGATVGCCAVHAEYLSGEQALRLPDMPDVRANPVLLYFLEHQLRQLQARTGGTAAHFRRRTRQALADAASVSPGTLRWGDTDLPARTVRVAPYLDDPYREHFAAEAATEYSFVLADAVPGVFYQLRASLPGTPREESLTLHSAEVPANDTR